MLHKAWNTKEVMPYCFARSSIKFQGHTGQNITDFDPNWAFPDYRPVAAFKSLRFALFHWFLISLGLHINLRCVEYRPQRPNFQVILGPKIDQNSRLQSFSQIFSTGFASFLFCMFIGGTFRCISMMCPKGTVACNNPPGHTFEST